MKLSRIRKKIESWSYSKWVTISILQELKHPTKNLIERLPVIFIFIVFIYYRFDDSFSEAVVIWGGLFVLFSNPIVLLDIWLCIKDAKLPDIYATILGILMLVLLGQIIKLSGWVVGISIWGISTSILLVSIFFIRIKIKAKKGTK